LSVPRYGGLLLSPLRKPGGCGFVVSVDLVEA